MIQVKNISKKFGSFQALKDVSFDIQKGEIVGILGKNGAGKTTLMRILTTFLPSTEGEIIISGKDAQQHSLFVRNGMGYLPENPPLYPSMKVISYLKFAGELRGITKKNLKSAVEKVMSECLLEEVAYKNIGLLSKGYKQRVGIAQAIIHDPSILILDEPTTGLDPIQLIQIRELIGDLQKQRTVILSSHILPEIQQMAQRVIILKSGQVALDEKIDKCQPSLEATFLRVHEYKAGVIYE